MKLTILFALALALHAQDAPPTVEQQLADAKQRIAQLTAELQRSSDAYMGCVVSRANAQQWPALNPAQQRMMQRAKPPEAQPVKPEVEK